MRDVDRRPLSDDLGLLAEHLKEKYRLSVQKILPPPFKPQLPCDISIPPASVIQVFLTAPIPNDLSYPLLSRLGFYDIKYIEPEMTPSG